VRRLERVRHTAERLAARPVDGPPATRLTGSPGPWTTACSVLAHADVTAATNGYGSRIVVTGHQPEESQNSPDDRISECHVALVGYDDADGLRGRTQGLEVSLVIDEIGALYYFPLRQGYQHVDGLGNDAAWVPRRPPKLIVRIGEGSTNSTAEPRTGSAV
jgi:hypothetical protein